MALDSGYVYCVFECIVCVIGMIDSFWNKRTKHCRIKWRTNCTPPPLNPLLSVATQTIPVSTRALINTKHLIRCDKAQAEITATRFHEPSFHIKGPKNVRGDVKIPSPFSQTIKL